MAGGLVVAAASGRPWAEVVPAAPVPMPAVALTGGQLQPALPALGTVLACGGLTVVATRGWLRTVVGGLLAVLAAGAAALAVATHADPSVGASRTVAGTVNATAVTGWWLVATAGAIVAAAAAARVVARGRGWPSMAARYERGRRRTATEGGRTDAAAAWDALDRGEDPTL